MLETNSAAFYNACEPPAPHRAPDEPKQTGDKTVISKKPLDFLLPFAVAANSNKPFLNAANLKSFVEPLAAIRSEESDELCLLDFLIRENRLPCLSDNIKPWHYPGWLLPYVILANRVHSSIVNRWNWWADCHLQNCLIDDPIPQVQFHSEFSRQTKASFAMIERCTEAIRQGGGSSWTGFTDFVDWLAWGCGTNLTKPDLNEKTNQALYKTFSIEPFVLFPSDHFGQYLSEQRGSGFNPNAFFPTPHTVCELITQINFGGAGKNALDARMLTVCDPAVGTGRQLLHASNHSVRLYGTDIDPLVVKICLINGALYAPWMSFPFPQRWFAAHDARKATKPSEMVGLSGTFDARVIAERIMNKLKIK